MSCASREFDSNLAAGTLYSISAHHFGFSSMHVVVETHERMKVVNKMLSSYSGVLPHCGASKRALCYVIVLHGLYNSTYITMWLSHQGFSLFGL
jgi:hypothetical protein